MIIGGAFIWISIQRKNAQKHNGQAVALDESKVPEVVDQPKVKTEVDLLLEKTFPIPSYKPLEELVQNWSDVPERAFPTEISVHIALEYQSQKGVSSKTMESDHLARPVSFLQGEIEVVTLDSPALTAKVSMADTDFKRRVIALYEEKKEEKISKILAQRELNRTKAIVHLVRLKLKKDNGLWASNDYTSDWYGLSLLATGNPKHAREVKKAARALAKKYNLGSNPSNKELV